MDAAEMRAMMAHEDRHWWYRGRRQIVMDELERLPRPADARLLDAGCGYGRMLDELAQLGRVSGVELDPDAFAVARERGHADLHEGKIEALPWADETFDLVTSLDVIEHTPDDRVTLRELRRVLRPNGRLLVTVPAYQALWSRHDVVCRHYRRYGRRSLRAAVAESGLAIERMTSFNSLLLAPAAAVRLLQRLRGRGADVPADDAAHSSDLEVGPAWLSPALELPLRCEAAWLRRQRTLPAGLSLLAVLRRA